MEGKIRKCHLILNNRYQVLDILGEGAFGKTYLAEDINMPSRRRCVIKQLKPIANTQYYELVKERFQREAAILEKLSDGSNQIPKLYAYFTNEDLFYLVQEWVDGPSLMQILLENGPLAESEVREL